MSAGNERVTLRRGAVICVAVLVAAVLQTAAAAAVAPPEGAVKYKGHVYDLVEVEYTDWYAAKAAAAAMPKRWGRCAHLATITSRGEQAVLATLMAESTKNAWLGGYQPPGEMSLADGWRWITGEKWNYTNWAAGEPNDTPGDTYIAGSEQWLEAYPGDAVWNDAPTPDAAKYFVVEYERCRRLPVHIVVDESLPIVIPDLPGDPFLATGPAVDFGVLCPAGIVQDMAWESRQTRRFIRLKVTKLFTCDDGTGTFEVFMRVKLFPDGSTTAKWKVTDGTGNYVTLRGAGKLVGTPFTGGITDVYTGTVKR